MSCVFEATNKKLEFLVATLSALRLSLTADSCECVGYVQANGSSLSMFGSALVDRSALRLHGEYFSPLQNIQLQVSQLLHQGVGATLLRRICRTPRPVA
ncbi:hypothetical protein DEU56DRAFT_166584 [Suillus clintonianus]|uniref:uncharacterized protein n=1 Tax=Suillus clintonianus TaxID=1904413 RepID=UPI001B868283|nr:uncharacterized protein DEU56DRAFT_166584 [Suillus clintonianus]KAG2146198.1 hypothetical protein DEU56DRAFT_166584 [Suillus clintonianus]